MEKSLHHVAGLSADVRSAVETIVGHALRDADLLYIATLGVGVEPPVAERRAVWDDLESIIAGMHQHAAQSALSSEQIDELIESESAAARYGRDE